MILGKGAIPYLPLKPGIGTDGTDVLQKHHFRSLVTVHPNDITDGGSVKISQHNSEQPSTRIFPRYCSLS